MRQSYWMHLWVSEGKSSRRSLRLANGLKRGRLLHGLRCADAELGLRSAEANLGLGSADAHALRVHAARWSTLRVHTTGRSLRVKVSRLLMRCSTNLRGFCDTCREEGSGELHNFAFFACYYNFAGLESF